MATSISTSLLGFDHFPSIGMPNVCSWPPATPFRRVSAAPSIPLSEIISALSFALDLTEGAVPGHAIRTCLYGMRIADELGLPAADCSALYYALLLKDIGCSSNAARMCALIGGDDRQMKHDVKFVDWTKPSIGIVTALWRQTLPQATILERSARMLRLAVDQDRNNRQMIELRCDRGASIARKIGLTEATAEAIRMLDEHWDGGGYPEQRKGHNIPLLARILLVAQHLDVFAAEQGLPEAMRELEARSGRWFDPELVSVTKSLYTRGVLQDAVGNFDHRTRVVQLQPGDDQILSAADVDRICAAFAEVVDAKSSFTYSHSIGVTNAAEGIAAQLGFGAERRSLIYRASLLHDLGKLSVPNTILDKPGKLNGDEWATVRGHAGLSAQILGRITHFKPIATIAGQHHEKLDGTGYPFGLSAEDLSLDARIIAVADIYGALSENRPYRESLATEQVLSMLQEQVPHKLDPDCFEALKRHLQSSIL